MNKPLNYEHFESLTPVGPPEKQSRDANLSSLLTPRLGSGVRFWVEGVPARNLSQIHLLNLSVYLPT